MKTVSLHVATSKQAVPWRRTTRRAELGSSRVGSRQLVRSRLGGQWAECWLCPFLGLPCTSASSSVKLELATPSSGAAGWTHAWEEPGVVSISSQECPSL